MNSSVPYEKGFALLNELQKRVGVEAFQAFAKDYIQEFRYVFELACLLEGDRCDTNPSGEYFLS